MTAPASAQSLDQMLRGTRFAGRVVVHDAVDSTIDECRHLADEAAAEGAVVLAREQLRGRGQRGHSWFSPPGTAVYLSALLRPPLAPADVQVLTAVAGLATVQACRDDFGVPCILKLPNDVLVPAGAGAGAGTGAGWRKLAGIMVDTAVQGDIVRHAVVSLGLNVTQAEDDFPPGLRGLATSLLMETDEAPAVERVAAAFLARLDQLRASMDTDSGWRQRVERLHGDIARDVPDFHLPAVFAPGASRVLS